MVHLECVAIANKKITIVEHHIQHGDDKMRDNIEYYKKHPKKRWTYNGKPKGGNQKEKPQ
jgi:hypothetical protein